MWIWPLYLHVNQKSDDDDDDDDAMLLHQWGHRSVTIATMASKVILSCLAECCSYDCDVIVAMGIDLWRHLHRSMADSVCHALPIFQLP